jgi:hypothetical protein
MRFIICDVEHVKESTYTKSKEQLCVDGISDSYPSNRDLSPDEPISLSGGRVDRPRASLVCVPIDPTLAGEGDHSIRFSLDARLIPARAACSSAFEATQRSRRALGWCG